MKTRPLPRGIRNNNPGNIVRGTDRWLGMAADQSPDARFVVFSDAEHGIRALMRLLINYQERHGLRTIREIVTRWAPPTGRDHNGNVYEQNTEGYIRAVVRDTGFGDTDPLDLLDRGTMEALTRAIVRHENGDASRWNRPRDWYDDATYDRALVLAGFAEARKPLVESRTIQGGAVAGGATLAAIVADATEQVRVLTFLPPETLQTVLGGLALIGIGAVLYARWDDWRRGRR